jgi:hypothetical protein
MKTWILVFLITILLAANCLAWTPVNVNDRGMLNHDGLRHWVNRGNGLSDYTFSSRTTLFGRESKFFYHFLRPEADIETIMIGDLRFNEFLPPCADEDTLSGRFEMAHSYGIGHVDSILDWDSNPEWMSPIIHFPMTGYTNRFFFSSLSRTQGNDWDDMVTQINRLPPGTPLVLRFVPSGQSGFLINAEDQPFRMAYTTDLAQETSFLDIGDPRIQYLAPEVVANFHGPVIRGLATRDPWTGGRAIFRFFAGNTEVASKEIALAWPEHQTRTNICIGLIPDFLMEYPNLTISANGQEGATCRVDSLTIYCQP